MRKDAHFFIAALVFLNMATLTKHRISPTRLALDVLTCLEELVVEVRPPPGSAARVLSAGAQRRSAPKVPQGSLKISL